jgi:hypothetical protein
VKDWSTFLQVRGFTSSSAAGRKRECSRRIVFRNLRSSVQLGSPDPAPGFSLHGRAVAFLLHDEAELAGPRAIGTWVGFYNDAAGLAGIVAPAVTGLIIDITGGFVGAFALAAAMAALGFIGWVLIVPRATAIEWGP